MNDAAKRRKVEHVRGRGSLVATFMLIVAAILAASGLAFYKYLEEIVVVGIGKQAEAMASVAARLVELRMDEYKGLETEADEAKPAYRELKGIFQLMRSDDLVRFVYTERRISESNIAYVIDSEEAGSPDASPLGQIDTLDELGKEAFASGRSVHGGLIDDPRWGRFITAYAPIRDRSGIEGLAGVDVSAKTIDRILRRAGEVILVVAALIFAIVLIPAFRLADAISRQLRIDGLTEAYVKRAILPDLSQAVARTKGDGFPLAVILLDLDRFKSVNDRFGHQAGDLVLRAAALAMRSALRYDDKLYRYGGEEFVLIMMGPPEARAMQAAELMRARVEATPISIGGEELHVTVSVGVALLAPDEGAESLLGRADRAMYEAKGLGRNRVVLAGGRQSGSA